MIEIVGNLFEFEGDAICLTTNGGVKKNGANVMGRGVALQASRMWPGIEHRIGDQIKLFGSRTHLLTTRGRGDRSPSLVMPARPGRESTTEELAYHVFMLPVKESWRERAKLWLIKRSLEELVKLVGSPPKAWRVALPRPGCGAGGLRWEDVRPICAEILVGDRFIIVERNP